MIVHPVMSVEPVEIGGKHFVVWLTNGRDARRFGPYPNAAIAQAKADKLIAYLQPNTPAVPATTNGTIILNGKPIELTSDIGRKLVVSACRAAENLISDAELRADLGIVDDAEFKAISESPSFINALRRERFARITSGRAVRESAAKIVAKGPEELGRHLFDPAGGVKGKVEIHRELRQTAHDGREESGPDAGEVFHIVINLGADEKFEKEVVLKQPQPPMIEGKADAEE